MLDNAILVLYITGLSFVFLFCVTQMVLAIYFLKFRKAIQQADRVDVLHEFPFITIQLPIYNELYVVERLIDAVGNFNYPKDKFEIQALDDSTDETLDLTKKKIAELQEKGINICLVQRKDRKGFKAGALEEGLKTALGEFIAIFDADFIPPENFLLQTIPHFKDEKLGLVQTKWRHLNRNYSIWTKVQAFALDAHFNVEQSGRNAAGVFMNFNGTAGVWRKSCIEDAGGWSFDTLTEDLDLSYRAQLKGWKFKYLPHVGAPAELPAEISAIKSQQYRWSKGPAEVSKKLMMHVLRADIPLRVKWLSFFHLLNSSVNIFILLTAILSVPLLLVKIHNTNHWAFSLIYVFFSGLLAIGSVYLVSQIVEEKSVKKGIKSFLVLFPTFLSLSMGLSLHNGLAALKGLFGGKTSFVRTPKHNIVNGNDSWKNKKYSVTKIDFLAVSEFFMAVYFLTGIFIAYYFGEYQMLPFHFMLFVGFAGVSFTSVKHALVAVSKD